MTLTNLSAGQRNNLLIRITCLFWITAKLMCWKLWLSTRMFPVVPPFDFLFVPSFIHLGLFLCSIVVLIVLLRYPSFVRLQGCLIVLELASCILDQNRWQPWEYQYIFTVLVFIINRKKEMNSAVMLRYMIAAIYFYSGVGKINPVFVQLIWKENAWMHHLPFAYRLGYLPGILEASFGIGLFFERFKKPAAILLIAMHLLILLSVTTDLINANAIVIPWNMAMISYLLVLAVVYYSTTVPARSIVCSTNILVLLLFGVMPAANFFGYWDYFLSSSFFSAKLPYLYICVPKKDGVIAAYADSSPIKTIFPCDSNAAVVSVTHWSFREINVPVYPEIRVYKAIRLQLLKRYPKMGNGFFIYSYGDGGKQLVDIP